MLTCKQSALLKGLTNGLQLLCCKLTDQLHPHSFVAGHTKSAGR